MAYIIGGVLLAGYILSKKAYDEICEAFNPAKRRQRRLERERRKLRVQLENKIKEEDIEEEHRREMEEILEQFKNLEEFKRERKNRGLGPTSKAGRLAHDGPDMRHEVADTEGPPPYHYSTPAWRVEGRARWKKIKSRDNWLAIIE